MLAFVSVRSERGPGDDSVARSLADCPEVLEVHHVAGRRLLPRESQGTRRRAPGSLLRTRFGRIPGVASTRTTIVLETTKETPRLHITRAPEAVS